MSFPTGLFVDTPEMQDASNTAAQIIQTNKAYYAASKATYERMYKTSKIPGTISPNDLEPLFVQGYHLSRVAERLAYLETRTKKMRVG